MGIVLQTYVIRESSTINAMSSFNGDVVGKVIEEQEEDAVIENMVREKILRKVKHAVGGHRVADADFMKVFNYFMNSPHEMSTNTLPCRKR